MTEDEARQLLGTELYVWDLTGRQNVPGAAAWREKARALRLLVPGLEPVHPFTPSPPTGEASPGPFGGPNPFLEDDAWPDGRPLEAPKVTIR